MVMIVEGAQNGLLRLVCVVFMNTHPGIVSQRVNDDLGWWACTVHMVFSCSGLSGRITLETQLGYLFFYCIPTTYSAPFLNSEMLQKGSDLNFNKLWHSTWICNQSINWKICLLTCREAASLSQFILCLVLCERKREYGPTNLNIVFERKK